MKLPEIINKIFSVTLIPYIWIFGLGVLIYQYRNSIIPFLQKSWLIFVLITYMAYYFDIPDINLVHYKLIRSILSILTAFAIGYRFKLIKIKHDISYELYLIHMIIINIFVQLGLLHDWSYFIITFFAALFLAFGLYLLNLKVLKKV